MNTRIAVLDRLIVFLAGLFLLAGGAWAVGLFFDVPVAQAIADRIDFPAWLAAPGKPWFDLVLAAILLVSAAIGGGLIALNLRRYRITRVPSPASDDRGSIAIDLNALAAAIAGDLAEHARIDSVQATVVNSWDRPTLTLTLRVHADIDVPALWSTLNQTEREFRQATPGIDVDTCYKLHLFPLER